MLVLVIVIIQMHLSRRSIGRYQIQLQSGLSFALRFRLDHGLNLISYQQKLLDTGDAIKGRKQTLPKEKNCS